MPPNLSRGPSCIALMAACARSAHPRQPPHCHGRQHQRQPGQHRRVHQRATGCRLPESAQRQLPQVVRRPDRRRRLQRLGQRNEQTGKPHHRQVDEVHETGSGRAGHQHADEQPDGAERKAPPMLIAARLTVCFKVIGKCPANSPAATIVAMTMALNSIAMHISHTNVLGRGRDVGYADLFAGPGR